MSLRCFFGIHDYKLMGRAEAKATYRRLFRGKTTEKVFTELWKCRRCGHEEGCMRDIEGSETTIDPLFLAPLRNDLCDECGKKGCSRPAPDYWPKDTRGVPNDAVYCKECWEAVDQDMQEAGYVPDVNPHREQPLRKVSREAPK